MAAAMGMVACDNDSPPPGCSGVAATPAPTQATAATAQVPGVVPATAIQPATTGGCQCISNPTMPGCSLQAAALSQVQGTPESAQAKALQAQNPGLRQVNLAGPNINPNTGAGYTNVPAGTTVNGIPVQNATDPNSIYNRLKGTSNAVLPADMRAPASVSSNEDAPIGIEGSGEAAR